MKQYDVCALGELLIDFTESGQSAQGNPLFEANPGGAPCNVLSMLAKSGRKTVFIGKVGNDIFGKQLRCAICDCGIDDCGLLADDATHTTLAFVHTSAGGERTFSFYRDPGADTLLCEADIDPALVENAKVLHFGSLSMTNETCEKATKKAIAIAKNAGKWLSFDPNLRENLWSSLDTAAEKIRYGLSVCDILKISDNELQWITGVDDFDQAIALLRKTYNIPLIFLTLGADGSRAYAENGYAEAAACAVEPIEKTGAGDTFCGCVLDKILAYGKTDLTSHELQDILQYANAAAAIVTTRKGALKVMPEKSEIQALLDTQCAR